MVYTVHRLATPSLAPYKPPLNLVLGGMRYAGLALGISIALSTGDFSVAESITPPNKLEKNIDRQELRNRVHRELNAPYWACHNKLRSAAYDEEHSLCRQDKSRAQHRCDHDAILASEAISKENPKMQECGALRPSVEQYIIRMAELENGSQ